jgi:hypothetical protein
MQGPQGPLHGEALKGPPAKHCNVPSSPSCSLILTRSDPPTIPMVATSRKRTKKSSTWGCTACHMFARGSMWGHASWRLSTVTRAKPTCLGPVNVPSTSNKHKTCTSQDMVNVRATQRLLQEGGPKHHLRLPSTSDLQKGGVATQQQRQVVVNRAARGAPTTRAEGHLPCMRQPSQIPQSSANGPRPNGEAER